MSDYVDPFEKESGSGSTLRPDPETPRRKIEVPADVPKIVQDVLAERGALSPVVTPLPPSRSSPRPRSAKKSKVERGDGKCPAYAQVGTKCKLCGKVHPL